jgi:hypothetical protein
MHNLLFYQRSIKKFSRFHPYLQKSYHVQTFLTFKLNDQCHDHNHGIVYSNDLVLCKSVRLGMTNNVAEESFHFLYTKNSFSIFWVAKMSAFVKQLPKFTMITGATLCLKILYHLGFKVHHLV